MGQKIRFPTQTFGSCRSKVCFMFAEVASDAEVSDVSSILLTVSSTLTVIVIQAFGIYSTCFLIV
jgi:hypothetical protein